MSGHDAGRFYCTLDRGHAGDCISSKSQQPTIGEPVQDDAAHRACDTTGIDCCWHHNNLGVASSSAPDLEAAYKTFARGLRQVFAAQLPDVPDTFWRPDMIEAFEAGAAQRGPRFSAEEREVLTECAEILEIFDNGDNEELVKDRARAKVLRAMLSEPS